jgi:predicted nucleic acid-binding protein
LVNRPAGLAAFLARHRRIGLDTAPLVYHLEGDPRYVEATTVLFTWLQRPGNSAVTSTLTLTELLVQPYRLKDHHRVAVAFAATALLRHLEWTPPTLAIADRAALLRAEYRLRTPDAIQASTALAGGATGFVTNDFDFKRVADLDVVVLEDVASGPF